MPSSKWKLFKITNKRFPNCRPDKTFLCHSYFMNATTLSIAQLVQDFFSFVNLFMEDEALIVFVPQLLLNKIFHFINHNSLFCPSIWLKWILITDNSYIYIIEHIEANLYIEARDIVFVILFLFFSIGLFVINVQDVLMFFLVVF